VILAAAAAVMLVAFVVPPIPQDLAYHDFADRRTLWRFPNFGDVVSNAPFLVVGCLGLLVLFRRVARAENRIDLLWLSFIVYFAGVGLVAFGSAYYHQEPTNETLFWDRLPMTIAFMALFAAIVIDRIDDRTGLILLPLLVVGIVVQNRARSGSAKVFFQISDAYSPGTANPPSLGMLSDPLVVGAL